MYHNLKLIGTGLTLITCLNNGWVDPGHEVRFASQELGKNYPFEMLEWTKSVTK